MTFISPYQFIRPRSHRANEPNKASSADLAFAEISKGASHVRHDYQVNGKLTGTLLVSVTTRTPTFIGAQRRDSDNESKSDEDKTNSKNNELRHFELRGKRAIPASTLRGVLSSTSELISNSSMRVLEDRKYSVRKAAKQALRAIGVIRPKNGSPGEMEVVPFGITNFIATSDDPKNWRIGNRMQKWERAFGTRNLDRFLATPYRRTHLRSFRLDEKEVAAMSLPPADTRFYACPVNSADRVEIEATRTSYLVLGRLAPSPPVPAATSAGTVTKGVVYSLDDVNGQVELPANKLNDLFIPWQANWPAAIPVAKEILENFKRICRERHNDDSNLPLRPRGYGIKPKEEEDFVRSGWLLFFDVDKDAKEVTELSYSAIWRRSVNGTVHESMCRAAGNQTDILPWSGARCKLTPAEALFGVIEEDLNDEDRPSRNLASRLSFSNAELVTDAQIMERQTIRPLGSPKPPSPAMYVQSVNGRSISKSELELDEHLLNGRKIYLSHLGRDSIAQKKWQSDDVSPTGQAHPQARSEDADRFFSMGGGFFRPLEANTNTFVFSIDVLNLSGDELSLLLAAVNPDRALSNSGNRDPFLHKIGMGKPFGLGAVELTPLAWVQHPSGSDVYTASSLQCGEPELTYFIATSRKKEVAQAIQITNPTLAHDYDAAGASDRLFDIEALRQDFRLVDQASLAELMSGDQTDKNVPICYPFTAGQQAYGTDEGFEWFVQTEDAVAPGNNQRHVETLDPLQDGKEPQKLR